MYKQDLEFRGGKIALGTWGYKAIYISGVSMEQDVYIIFFFPHRAGFLWFLMSSAKINPGGPF